MTDIKVTQADKEAASRFEELDWPGNHAAWTAMVEQAFARHRIEAQRPLLEALIIALDSMESVDGENDCSRGIKSVDAAIKQAKGE